MIIAVFQNFLFFSSTFANLRQGGLFRQMNGKQKIKSKATNGPEFIANLGLFRFKSRTQLKNQRLKRLEVFSFTSSFFIQFHIFHTGISNWFETKFFNGSKLNFFTGFKLIRN